MTNINTALIPSAKELLSTDTEKDLKSAVHKLMRLTSGGRKLNETQAAELAVFSLMTDLNPFNNECYYMITGGAVGPIPGVAGYRRKANEYLAVTSGPTDRYNVTFRDALPGEASFDAEAGDIARTATLRIRSVSDSWRAEIISIFKDLKDGGIPAKQALQEARDLVGPEPVWTASAVVDHREKFGREPGTKSKDDPGTPDKWDRYERCDKRAEKWAIRKAFPSVILPDISLGGSLDLDPNVIDAIVRDVVEERKGLPEWGVVPSGDSEEEILESIGVDGKPGGYPSKAQIEEDIVEAVQESQPDPDPDKPDPNEEPPKEKDKKAPAPKPTGDPVTDFWTHAKYLGIDMETANSIVAESGKDFEKAYKVLLSQHTPPA